MYNISGSDESHGEKEAGKGAEGEDYRKGFISCHKWPLWEKETGKEILTVREQGLVMF